MEEEKTPTERLHDDIREMINRIENDNDDEIIRIHTTHDDAG
tara:strand:- start:62 stop:187 length:126 start_codon:yes stop_codon:yes gene_type:complete